MKVFDQKQSREFYFETQIFNSQRKFSFCKVSMDCVRTWKLVITRCLGMPVDGPIICLATRNGREIDVFRTVFFGGSGKNLLLKILERRIHAFSSRLPFVEAWGKDDIQHIEERSVYGVELNPAGERRDVLIASFDDLPKDWEGRFQVVYSNSLDHAQDPYRTAKEWWRVLKPGGYLILGWPGEDINPSEVDVVGNIGLKDVQELFPGELIYFNKFGNAFRDAIIRKTK
jgi:SAM-dependent methyltransferase